MNATRKTGYFTQKSDKKRNGVTIELLFRFK